MKKILINGKVFNRKNITGLQRYISEILKEMDNFVEENMVEILVPKKYYNLPKFKNIKVKETIHIQEILWEQIILPIYAIIHKRTIVNMTNSSPILKPDILVIHDIVAIKQKKFFRKAKAIYYRYLFALTIKRAKQLITVSEFSKNEIAQYYHIDKEKIEVIYNGWQHIKETNEEIEILEKIKNLTNGKKYFFSLGTLTKHKNLKWVINAAKNNPQYTFLISGFKNSQKIYKELGIESTENVKYLGYLTDEEMKTVIKNAEALIFPSYYEGFGIPPLEAITLGTKAIVSDIPVLKEIYGNAVYYIDPDNPNIDLDKLMEKEIKKEEIKRVLKKYSWKKSAEKLLKIINK